MVFMHIQYAIYKAGNIQRIMAISQPPFLCQEIGQIHRWINIISKPEPLILFINHPLLISHSALSEAKKSLQREFLREHTIISTVCFLSRGIHSLLWSSVILGKIIHILYRDSDYTVYCIHIISTDFNWLASFLWLYFQRCYLFVCHPF